MHNWFVSAAVGARCLAKYWQNVLKEREGLSEPLPQNLANEKSGCVPLVSNESVQKQGVELGRLGSPYRSHLFRKRVQKQSDEEASSNSEGISSNVDERFSEISHLDVLGSSANEMTSTGKAGDEAFFNSGNYGESNVSSFSSLWPPFVRDDNHLNDGDASHVSGSEPNSQPHLLQPKLYNNKNGVVYEFGRGRSSSNCKWPRGYSVKPRNSLESCLIAQLYKEQEKVEEYVFSSLPLLSAPVMRPLVVTDGNQIISKATYDLPIRQVESRHVSLQAENTVGLRGKESEYGVCRLPDTGLIKLPKREKRRSNTLNARQSRKHSRSQGSSGGIFLFCLGISIGMMSTILSNKKEVDELNELLEQTKNLVQDLHEELEMKESLTVKELVDESFRVREINCSSFDVNESINFLHHEAPTGCSPNLVADGSNQFDVENVGNIEGDNLESMTKIEEELVAELERLEMNIRASSLQRRLSDLGELDPELVAEVAHGDLRVDTVNGGPAYSDHETGGSSTTQTQPANYGVSPKELSLRLHELIESRLEERICELESALHDTQKQLRFMEAQRDFSNSDFGSSSTSGSPNRAEHSDVMTSPLYLNLAGEALSAYNEAYMEFSRIDETKEESPPSTASESIQNSDGLHMFRQTASNDWIGAENGHSHNFEIIKKELSHIGKNEDDGFEDEMGMLLIKQIVEKTRQGSPLVLNAQRVLFSMDDEQCPFE